MSCRKRCEVCERGRMWYSEFPSVKPRAGKLILHTLSVGSAGRYAEMTARPALVAAYLAN
jgi:hypothetical protein